MEPKCRWIAALFSLCWVVVGCSPRDPQKHEKPSEQAPKLVWRETPEPVESAPISLTASDGSGLVLVSMRARAVVEDPLAFTELHLTFHNPEPRRREGRFAITLPQEAAISRFAMKTGAGWQEGEVVERRRAQAVYEDFLHRKEDPALLERDAGNQFTARVFPIEPNATKEIIVAYSEELQHSEQPYRLLLKGLPRLEHLKVEVLFGSSSDTGRESSMRARGPSHRLALEERDHVPVADLAVEVPQAGRQLALRSGELAVARVRAMPKVDDDPVRDLTVLFDTSASRALGFEAQIERLGALLSELTRRENADFELRVVAFDQTVEDIYRGPVSGFSTRDKARLVAREALGASDLSAGLAHLASDPGKLSRLLVITDGVVTAGVQDTTSLREAVAKLSAHGLCRVDVLAEGGIRDAETLEALTRAGLRSAGLVLDARLSVQTLAEKLAKGTRERMEVHVPSASWVHPEVLEGVQEGDEFLVFAELAPEHPLRVILDGTPIDGVATLEAPRPLLERSWARRKIASLSAKLRSLRAGEEERARVLEGDIVKLSTKHRVLSDLTALLVLETEHDYRRFGLDPQALTNILRVGEHGIEVFDRKPVLADEAKAKLAEQAVERAEPLTEWARAEEASGPGVPQDRPVEAPRRAAPATSKSVADESLAARAAAPAARSAARERASVAPEPPRPAPAPAASAPMPAPALARGSAGGALNDVLGGGGALSAAARASTASGLGAAAGSAGTTTGADRAPTRDAEGVAIASASLEPQAIGRLHRAFGVDESLSAKVVRGALANAARTCYGRATARAEREQLTLEFSLSDKGSVGSVFVSRGRLLDARAQQCVLTAAERLQFPKPTNDRASVEAGLEFSMRPVQPQVNVAAQPAPAPARRPAPAAPKPPTIEDAYEGVLADTLRALSRGDHAEARKLAEAAHADDPGDVMALIALGEALEAQGEYARAARAYGSLIDLFPSRPDLRRMAGARLERLPQEHGLKLAVDTYQRAVTARPDHPSGHRLLAYAQLKRGDYEAAFATVDAALRRGFAWSRFEGVERILREDLSLIAAAWLRASPEQAARIQEKLKERDLQVDRTVSLRFVLNWETDANDVDFHIYDGRGGHAYYMQRRLPSGGTLYADITSGYGPECFAITGRAQTYPYTLRAHYYARGPMGYGMGKLQVIEHDGQGVLRFSEHPFAIMKDKAYVQLAELRAPLAQIQKL